MPLYCRAMNSRPWCHDSDTPGNRLGYALADCAAFAASVQQFEIEERQFREQDLLEGMPLGRKVFPCDHQPCSLLTAFYRSGEGELLCHLTAPFGQTF